MIWTPFATRPLPAGRAPFGRPYPAAGTAGGAWCIV